MDEQDKRLRQLIAQVCQHPDGSCEWRRAMHRLLVTVQGLPEFKRYSYQNCPEYKFDALNRTWEWFSRNLRSFEPRTSLIRQDLVKWIDGYLYWRIKDLAVAKTYQETSLHYSLDAPIKANCDGEKTSRLEQLSAQGEILGTPSNPYTLSGLEIYIESLQKQSEQRIAVELADYIEQDPDMRLKKCYPRNHPECNSQLLSQRLLFIFKNPPDTLASIAREFNINYQTLVSHWKLKTIPLLKEAAIRFGYSDINSINSYENSKHIPLNSSSR